ncbi:MAG: hypothetical protein ABIA47_03360 [bacterium]
MTKRSAESRSPEFKSEMMSFSDQLAKIWERTHPEAIVQTCDEQKSVKQDLEHRESAIADKELADALREYGIDPEKITFVGELNLADENHEPQFEKVFKVAVESHFSNERLPEGYGYEGGAARSLLMRALEIDLTYTPRDLDIIRLSDEEPSPGADDEISQKLMLDDYAKGHRVEVVGKEEKYFATRDLSINQLLATDTEIIATRQCILDTVRKIIRPTEFERNRFAESGSLGPKMLSKILRFYVQSIHRYDSAVIEDVEDWEFENYFINPFYLALHLDKAFETGNDVAESYVDELIARGQLPEYIEDAADAANYLAELIKGGNFYYRHAPTEQFETEADWISELEDEFELLPKFRGTGKSRGEK